MVLRQRSLVVYVSGMRAPSKVLGKSMLTMKCYEVSTPDHAHVEVGLSRITFNNFSLCESVLFTVRVGVAELW